MASSSFADLLKTYRLKSGISTLTELADLLAEKGFVYETSIFSHWQKGTRKPRDRDALIALIQIFAKRSGITSIEEANNILESLNQSNLSRSELTTISELKIRTGPFLAPRRIRLFVGRQQEQKSIQRALVLGKTVLIGGPAGYGKTSLAIKIAHKLRTHFCDGVLWFRVDTMSNESIMSSIIELIDDDDNRPKANYDIRSRYLNLINSRKVLIILDNLEQERNIEELFPSMSKSVALATSRYQNLSSLFDQHIYLQPFTKKESKTIFKVALGSDYVSKHGRQLETLAHLVGHLPLAINLMSQYFLLPYNSPSEYILQIKDRKLHFERLIYDNSDLFSVISLTTDQLNEVQKLILSAFGWFKGETLSTEFLIEVFSLDPEEVSSSLKLMLGQSLIEYGSHGRYRVHPIIKLYIQQYMPFDQKLYGKAITYYILLLKKQKKKLNTYRILKNELANIIGLLEDKFIFLNNQLAYNLWDTFSSVLWLVGRWEEYLDLAQKVYSYLRLCGNNHNLSNVCRRLSEAWYWKGNLKLTEFYIQKGMEYSEGEDDKAMLALAVDRLGKVYLSKKKYTDALKAFKRSADLYPRNGRKEDMGNIYRHIAETYMLANNCRKAEDYLDKAVSEYSGISELSKRKMYEIFTTSHSGIIALIKKDRKIAKKLFHNSLQMERKLGGRGGTKIATLLGMGLLYEEEGKEDLAQKCYEEASQEVEFMGIRESMNKSHIFSLIFKDKLRKSKLYRKVFA